MIIVRVTHVSPQYPVAFRLVETELEVLGVEVQIGFGAGQSEEQVAVGEVGQLVAGRRGHRRRAGRRRRVRRIQKYCSVDERGET